MSPVATTEAADSIVTITPAAQNIGVRLSKRRAAEFRDEADQRFRQQAALVQKELAKVIEQF